MIFEERQRLGLLLLNVVETHEKQSHHQPELFSNWIHTHHYQPPAKRLRLLYSLLRAFQCHSESDLNGNKCLNASYSCVHSLQPEMGVEKNHFGNVSIIRLFRIKNCFFPSVSQNSRRGWMAQQMGDDRRMVATEKNNDNFNYSVIMKI